MYAVVMVPQTINVWNFFQLVQFPEHTYLVKLQKMRYRSLIGIYEKHILGKGAHFENCMFRLLLKIFKTPDNILPIPSNDAVLEEVVSVGEKIQENVKRLFRGSLAIRQVDAGSDNACEQELVALSNSFYDVERFGIHFVASPRHADMLLVTGPVTRNMAYALKSAYDATPEPKIVVSVGDDALDGGVFKGSYAVVDGVQSQIPVHYHIPGDPPSPMQILKSLLGILESLDTKSRL